jgi:Protein of unknown function (DUF3303)
MGDPRDPLIVTVRYMVIERFTHGAEPVYERLAGSGRMLPDGLSFIESWVDRDMGRCFQLMEADDDSALAEWTAAWSDLVEFEIVPVISSSEASTRALRQ